ncbi:MAG: hypothetical protein IPP90_02850 [Gemmatimonadaceae bacterium]|nr:hypothetical protein [Gemmatimonadaceae bacterium]
MLSPFGMLQAQTPRVIRETAAQWRSAPALTLSQERVWCADGDAPGCDFKRPASVRALPDGGLLAADAQGPLNRFGADGRFIATLGRRGQGPGEYGFVIEASLASSGLVTWFDNTQMRITTVKLDGTAGPITRLMPPYTMALMFLVDTSLVVLDVPAAARVGELVNATYRTVPATGAPRILARVRTPSTFTVGNDMRPMSGPFDVRVIGDVGPSGDVAHSNGTRYEIALFPSGGTPCRLEVDAPLRPVTSAERDSALAAIINRFRVSNANELPPTVRAAYLAPRANHPPLSLIKVLRDGTVWIRPTPAAGTSMARWDVFARDGRRLGAANLPLPTRVWDGGRDWVLVNELGDDDIPRFVRYRVGR